MSKNVVDRGLDVEPSRLARHLDRLILKACRAAMARIDSGLLHLTLPSGESASIGHAPTAGNRTHAEAALAIANYAVFWKSLRRGSIGFAESYMAGDVETADLASLFRFFIANQPTLTRAGGGHFKVRLGDKSWHRRRDNTRDGSRRNIAAHYDLGNAFYASWLDASMTYSSALFQHADDTIEVAQQRKLDRIVEALAIEPEMSVLEIGCGWGALAERLARAGARVTALTVSAEQFAHTQARMAAAGLVDRVDVRFCDYRDIDGLYDRVVSIEMIEAVGEAHWPVYFGAIADRLKSGGHAVLQAITIAPERFEHYKSKPDFIQRYIFPGGMLPTEAIMATEAFRAGLASESVVRFGASYARTLDEWRDRFEAAWPSLVGLGFDERFRRMWVYYLTYCSVGFETGLTEVGLYRLDKAR